MEDAFSKIWEDLLSCQANKVKHAFTSLDEDAQQVVLEHLHRMVEEEGWHQEQRRCAGFALNVLQKPGELRV
jgi:hypothetical protein